MKPVALLGVVRRLQIIKGSSVSHLRPNLFSLLKILGLKPCRIMPLVCGSCRRIIHLAVHLWVRHCKLIHAYVVVVVERQELLACELGDVVGDDRVRDPEPEDDVGEE